MEILLEKMDKEYTNIPNSVITKLNRNLYKIKSHPLEIIKNKIFNYFMSKRNDFVICEDLEKVVSIQDNFDNLLIPQTHVSRTKSDTYYLNKTHVLRTHTTAHQTQLFKQNICSFLVCGDVYRRDEVDSCHYNIFHQLEGAILWEKNVSINLEEELCGLMSGLCEHLFPGCEYRIKSDYFPFTNPSWEIEVNFNSKWLEILGCGVIQPEILANSNQNDKKGIAWGLGLERLAMVLFDIPDIRYFWMEDDEKFLSQFKSGEIIKFTKFSPLEPISKDISLFVKSEDIESKTDTDTNVTTRNWTRLNQFYEILRELSMDWVGEIKLIDSYYNKKNPSNVFSQSYCFRLIYSPKDYKITNPGEFEKVVNKIQTDLVNELRKLDWIQIRG